MLKSYLTVAQELRLKNFVAPGAGSSTSFLGSPGSVPMSLNLSPVSQRCSIAYLRPLFCAFLAFFTPKIEVQFYLSFGCFLFIT